MSSILSTVPLYLLANPPALNRWLDAAGKSPDWTLWAYAAFTQRDGSRPDHVFEKRWERFANLVEYRKKTHLFDLMEAIRLVAEGYLEIVNGRLYVKNEGETPEDALSAPEEEENRSNYSKSSHFDRWQNIRARMSTWPLKLYMLHRHHCPADYFLSHPLEPVVADFIRREGLNETHLHLNGCLYPEEEWLKEMYDISAFLEEETKAFQEKSVIREHYILVNERLTPLLVANRLKLARVLRNAILLMESTPLSRAVEILHCAESAIRRYALNPRFFAPSAPAVEIPRDLQERKRQEMRMWMRAFNMLEAKSDFPYKQRFQHLLHLYLLLENEHIYLNSHTERRKGFAAFDVANDHTKLAVKGAAYYRHTFYNLLKTAEARGCNYIEVRVAPGALKDKHELYLSAYEHACRRWEDEQKGSLRMQRELPPQSIRRPQLILVAHLIKRKPKELSKDSLLLSPLFESERKAHMAEASALAKTAQHLMEQHRVPVAIDAANSELNQAPEVFAPAYRLFERASGISHKTYHCGEDFLHLISGIRAVYEAVSFLDLRNGNRIGHGVAIGVHPRTWVKSMPSKLLVSSREWLLNMIFVWKVLHEINPAAAGKAEREAVRVAGCVFAAGPCHKQALQERGELADSPSVPLPYNSIHTLSHFFEMREFEPTYVRKWLDKGLPLSKVQAWEWKCMDEKKKQFGSIPAMLYWEWNINPACRRAQEELIEVKSDFLTVAELIQLQQQVQHLIANRDVVVETLPVSNLRIGQIRRIQEHHILRWLKVGKYKVVGDADMNICMGSDDPGVFATDLKNEYYHLYMCLRNAGVPAHEAVLILRRVNNAGRIYAFSKLPALAANDYKLSSLLNNTPQPLNLWERLDRYTAHREQEGNEF